MRTDKRFSGLDGLRAIACLLVIFHHIAQRIDIFSQHYIFQHVQLFFLMGNTGVSFFFVLSGFLLSYPFWEHYLMNRPFPDMLIYAKKRATRILPGYYASLLVSLILALLLVPNIEFFGRRVLAALTLTSGFHYTTFFPSDINGPLWSISFEVFAYFLMPLFMFVVFLLFKQNRTFKKIFIFWIFVFLVILGINQLIHTFLIPDNVKRGWRFGIIGGAKWWMPNYNPIGFFGHFIFGIFSAGICYYLKVNTQLKEKLARKHIFDRAVLISSLVIIALLSYVSKKEEFTFSWQNQPYYFPYLTLLIAILVISLVNSERAGKMLDNRFMRFTAKISFGLYIWHYIIILLISTYILPDYAYNMAIKEWPLWLGASLLLIVVSYGIATLSYYFLELPFIRRSHNRVKKTRYSLKSKISLSGLLSTAILVLLALFFLFPLIWLLDASLRPPFELIQSPPVIFRQPFWKSIESYTRNSFLAAFLHYDAGRALFNSIIVTSGTLALTGIVSSLYAYALVFIKFRYKRFFFILAISTMMIPINALMIPFYSVVKSIGLINNWFGLILPGAISGFGVFLIRQYFLKIPRSIIEAAHIDGAGHLRIWWHIILPLLRPALAALAIIQFRIVWNDFLFPSIVLRDDNLYTLPVKILLINDTGAVLATGLISIIVPLLLFLKFHRQFTGELTGGIKN